MRLEAEDDDDALLARAGGGDAAAFRLLAQRHAGMALAVARRLVGEPADAEDIVQEAFLRAWRQAPRWRPGGAPFRGWLLHVVANLCRDRARRARHRRHEPLEVADAFADPAPHAETRLAERDLGASVVAAVRALPERQRAAVALTYAAGLRNAEAASSMGLSIEAFEALLVRARRTLRAVLAGRGEGETGA